MNRIADLVKSVGPIRRDQQLLCGQEDRPDQRSNSNRRSKKPS
jgi:hypothetical protein